MFLFYTHFFFPPSFLFFFFNDPATTDIYTLSLHDALPIFSTRSHGNIALKAVKEDGIASGQIIRRKQDGARSEEHTSELQSRFDLVCRLLLEKKKKKKIKQKINHKTI